MKFCKDCKKIRYSFETTAICIDPASLISINPVTGKEDYRQCRIMRSENFQCYGGKLFEEPEEKPISFVDAIVLKILKYLR